VKFTFEKYVLSDDGQMSPASLVLDGSRVIQVDELVRGGHLSIIDRQNKATRISFSVNREHASYSAAQQFCVEHNDALPGTGELLIEMRKDNGGLVSRVCKNAGLQSVRSVHRGCRTETAYVFVCGEFIVPKST
jgi:hypothetical protein